MKISKIILFLLIQILICNRLIAQGTSICYFKYEKENIYLRSIDKRYYYYAVDSAKLIKYKGATYYGFIFNNDTTRLDGYINFDLKHFKIRFINIDDLQSCKDTSNVIQIISTINKRKSHIKKMGIIGWDFTVKVSHVDDKLVLNIFHNDGNPSHYIFVIKLIFDNKMKPDKLFLKMQGEAQVYELNRVLLR
jgi:hypothetical protein